MAVKHKRINEEILSGKIQVITEEGENIGTLTRMDALRKAEELEMDLVELSEKDGMSVAKLMDYGKFVFKQQKSLSKNKGQSRKNDPKMIRLTYSIGTHDIEIRRNQARTFAKDGYPLKVAIILRGRENQYEQLAVEKLREFITSLEDIYRLDGTISRSGKMFTAMLSLKK